MHSLVDAQRNALSSQETLCENKRPSYSNHFGCVATMVDCNNLAHCAGLFTNVLDLRNETEIHILALDKMSFDFLTKFMPAQVQIHNPISYKGSYLTTFLRESKRRSRVFQLKPRFIRRVLDLTKKNVLYADSDLLFRTLPFFRRESAVLLLFRHHHGDTALDSKYGIFNAGLIGVRNSSTGRKLLELWDKQCEEYCGDSEGHYYDQKYLEDLYVHNLALCEEGSQLHNVGPWSRTPPLGAVLSYHASRLSPSAPFVEKLQFNIAAWKKLGWPLNHSFSEQVHVVCSRNCKIRSRIFRLQEAIEARFRVKLRLFRWPLVCFLLKGLKKRKA